MGFLKTTVKVITVFFGTVIAVIILLIFSLAVWEQVEAREPEEVKELLYDDARINYLSVKIPEFKVTRYRFQWKQGDEVFERHLKFKEPFDPADVARMDSLCRLEKYNPSKSLMNWARDSVRNSYTYVFDNIGGANCTDSVIFYPSQHKADYYHIHYTRWRVYHQRKQESARLYTHCGTRFDAKGRAMRFR